MRSLAYNKYSPEIRTIVAAQFYKELLTHHKDWENRWRKCKRAYSVVLSPFKTMSIKDIVVAPFSQLIQIYTAYQSIDWTKITDRRRINLLDKLCNIFNYDQCHNYIAEFMIEHESFWEISTCNYCEMTYVNKYNTNPREDARKFLNEASAERLKSRFPQATDADVLDIINKRVYLNGKDYNQLSSITIKNQVKNLYKKFQTSQIQFDIDHVLDKGSCPLVALSVFNFVPCCPVCNTRLKSIHTLEDNNGKVIEKLSPTSSIYAFDDEVKIQVLPIKTFDYETILQDGQSNFKVNFMSSKDYRPTIDLFRLEERYQQHIVEALRIIDLYHRYPKQYMEMMCEKIDGLTPAMLQEDLFAENFTEKYHRTFAKLRRDTLELCRTNTTYTTI